MKKVLLILLICVMINSGKELFNAGRIAVSRLTNVDPAFIKVFVCPESPSIFTGEWTTVQEP